MFSDISNVNIVTSLLVAHNVRHVVVCPGSRNAPLVHDFHVHEKIKCYPITDERSAGFFALGMAQALEEPVAVCVTSGSAVLNLAPAVAEAAYQHVMVVVVSADRPMQWIGQLDGQTLPQTDVFGRLVNKAVSLPSAISNEEQRWLCNRLVNEALLATAFPKQGPVHINVPIEEPLFRFSVKHLPNERIIRRTAEYDDRCMSMVARWLLEASRPMVVVGQISGGKNGDCDALCRKGIDLMASIGVLIVEKLCRLPIPFSLIDEALTLVGDDADYVPDLIVFVGGNVVSKKLKSFMRKAVQAKVVMINMDGDVNDVSMHATDVVVGKPVNLFRALAVMQETMIVPESGEAIHIPEKKQRPFHQRWRRVLDFVGNFADEYVPQFSQMAAVKYFEQQLEDMEYDFHVHYANSMAIRLANIYAGHHVMCNRGVNGIEGSLSTAAGFSVEAEGMTFCVVGDLSFFYDQNALWNVCLNGKFRIVLLNNGGGAIFKLLNGLESSEARDELVSGAHKVEARGICEQNDVGYIRAANMEEMEIGMVTLVTEQTNRPMLLEIVTDAETDASTIKNFINQLKELWQRENGKK